MTEEQILAMWRSGYSKYKVAETYKRIYNDQIKIIRLDVRNRHAGRMISSYEALSVVEKIILKEVKKFERNKI